jgi:hypothetical protein
MSRAASAAAACAVGLVVAAGVAVVALEPDLTRTATTVRTQPTPDPTSTGPDQLSATPTATTAPTVPRGPITLADARTAMPQAGGDFEAADLRVELGSVCEGATFDLVGASAAHASLQSTEDPLQYLDAVVVVYDTVPTAATAYERIAEAIGQCPSTRTATPEPTAPDARSIPIEIQGEVRSGVVVEGRAAIQWLQLQSADGTELRTAITVALVENALVAISMDEDSETASADDLAGDSIAQAAAVVAALSAAAVG